MLDVHQSELLMNAASAICQLVSAAAAAQRLVSYLHVHIQTNRSEGSSRNPKTIKLWQKNRILPASENLHRNLRWEQETEVNWQRMSITMGAILH